MIYCFDKPDINIKIMLLGDSYVGKTTLINRIASGTFLKFHEITISLDFVPIYKKLNLNGKEYLVKTTLVDTIGTEMYNSVAKTFIKQCDGFMLIYDISKIDGLKDVKKWKKLIDDSIKSEAIMLVGNKSDLGRKIDRNIAEKLAKDLNIMFGKESTCKNLNDINIEDNMLLFISKITLEKITKKNFDFNKNTTQIKKKKYISSEGDNYKKEGGCC